MPAVIASTLDDATIAKFIAELRDSDAEYALSTYVELRSDRGYIKLDGTEFGGFDATGPSSGTITKILWQSTVGAFQVSSIVISANSLKTAVIAQDTAAVSNLLFGRNDKIDGSDGNNVLYGYAGNDLISGYQGDDKLYGGDGNDSLDGGLGNDTLIGGAGDDILHGNNGDDYMDGGDGVDAVTFNWLGATTGVTLDLKVTGPQNTGHGLDTILNVENAEGTRFDDVIHGTNAANILSAGSAGNDKLYGYGGDDTLLVPMIANAVIDGGGGVDTLSLAGAVREWTVDLSKTQAQVVGTGFNPLYADLKATITGIENLDGGPYGDTLKAAPGGSRIRGGAVNDLIYGADGADTLEGNAGDDEIDGGGGFDVAVYNGKTADYTVTDLGGGSWIVKDNRAGSPEGTDKLFGIEVLRFSDSGALPIVATLTSTPSTIANGAQGTVKFTITLNVAADQDLTFYIRPNQWKQGEKPPVTYQYKTDWTLEGAQSDYTYNPALDAGVIRFTKGQQTKTFEINIPKSEFTIGSGRDTFQIALESAASNPSHVSVSKEASSATGVVNHPDAPAARLALSYSGDFGADWTKYKALFEADLQAAMARVVEALPKDLQGVTVQIQATSFSGEIANTLAAAAPHTVLGWFKPPGTEWLPSWVALPEALARYTTGKDADPARADIILNIDPSRMLRFYGGEPDVKGSEKAFGTVDAQTVLAHELLHGLGYGAYIPNEANLTPWRVILDKTNNVIVRDADGKPIVLGNGSVDLGKGLVVPAIGADYGHLAANNSLMRPNNVGPQNISALDEAVLKLIGYSPDALVNVGLLPKAVQDAWQNLLRGAAFSDMFDLFGSFSGGSAPAPEGAAALAAPTLTTTEIIAELVKRADATTSVATLSYQFFTGKIPSEAGIDYLVSPFGPNPNNLNAQYYQSFSLENRYINFAVNLGKVGEGHAKFEAAYGELTLFQATKKAYEEIFGLAPTDAKVAALLEPAFVIAGRTMTRAQYFEAYGADGPTGIGTKAAMVGWLLAEAEKADIGQYALSNAAFLTDLADGASFAIDLIGVYGRASYDFGG